MPISRKTLLVAAAPLLGLAAPVFAQDAATAPPPQEKLATCSAKVTDHCMQRGARSAATNPGHAKTGGGRHHHHSRRHHHR